MNIQRLRNLTTHRLHTKMEDIYEDIELLTGEKGVMTHMLPNACRTLEPYLRAKIGDPRFWDGNYDTGHTGDFEIDPMLEQERSEFWERFSQLKSPLSKLDKRKIVVVVT